MLEQVLSGSALAHVGGQVEGGAVLARAVPGDRARLRVLKQVRETSQVGLADGREEPHRERVWRMQQLKVKKMRSWD